MTDRPIIFSAPMVQALLDGRKTQTRRLAKPDPDTFPNGFAGVRLPYAPGDRLYVREAWAPNEVAPGEPIYRADYGSANGVHAYNLRDGLCDVSVSKWKPSIHMPRWASRLTLIVTDVRVQRLQEISEADAAAEGVAEVSAQWQDSDEPVPAPAYQAYGQDACYSGYGAARLSFMTLWNSLHGPGAWDANPWVAAVTFTVKRGNIDVGGQHG